MVIFNEVREMGIINFLIDIIESIYDLFCTWREKEESKMSKFMYSLFVLFLLVVSAKIWL